MNGFYKRTLGLLLVLSCLFSAFGCRQPEPPEKENAIQIEEDAEYDAQTLALAQETFFDLAVYAYSTFVSEKISDTMMTRLEGYAARIADITTSIRVPQERYLSIITLWAESGRGAIDELWASSKGYETSLETVRSLYLEMTYVFGAQTVASMLYDGCLLIYDARYERRMEKLETTGYPWYREEADAIAAQKAIFEKEVGRASFCILVRFSTALAELLAVSPDAIPTMFSDAELLEIVRHLDLSDLDISEAGWELLLSYGVTREESGYASKLAEIFVDSGDISSVAAVMNDAVALTVSVMNKLTSADMGLLRAGETEELLGCVFSHFDENDWSLFQSVTAVSLSNERYSALAESTYGAAYGEYLSGILAVDLSLLRESVGDEDFYQNLASYLSAICPAISYEVYS